jgi:hypothetical protein
MEHDEIDITAINAARRGAVSIQEKSVLTFGWRLILRLRLFFFLELRKLLPARCIFRFIYEFLKSRKILSVYE